MPLHQRPAQGRGQWPRAISNGAESVRPGLEARQAADWVRSIRSALPSCSATSPHRPDNGWHRPARGCSRPHKQGFASALQASHQRAKSADAPSLAIGAQRQPAWQLRPARAARAWPRIPHSLAEPPPPCARQYAAARRRCTSDNASCSRRGPGETLIAPRNDTGRSAPWRFPRGLGPPRILYSWAESARSTVVLVGLADSGHPTVRAKRVASSPPISVSFSLALCYLSGKRYGQSRRERSFPGSRGCS